MRTTKTVGRNDSKLRIVQSGKSFDRAKLSDLAPGDHFDESAGNGRQTPKKA